MSSNVHTPHDAGDAHHDHGHDGHGHGGHEASHGTFKSYMIGFVLSVILTVIPFWVVMAKQAGHLNIDTTSVVAIVMILGAIQIVVHMIYFLHMDTKSEGGWNMMALIFTITLVVIALSGSMWVMYHLNANMMPVSTDIMRNMP
jgi:cytochrome o ubiquinol oxidase operon protein cyoD